MKRGRGLAGILELFVPSVRYSYAPVFQDVAWGWQAFVHLQYRSFCCSSLFGGEVVPSWCILITLFIQVGVFSCRCFFTCSSYEFECCENSYCCHKWCQYDTVVRLFTCWLACSWAFYCFCSSHGVDHHIWVQTDRFDESLMSTYALKFSSQNHLNNWKMMKKKFRT